MGMLGASAPKGGGGRRRLGEVGGGALRSNLHQPSPSSPTSPVLLFRGCIMDGLFSHVHDATIRTLEVNGYEVRSPNAGVLWCAPCTRRSAGRGATAGR